MPFSRIAAPFFGFIALGLLTTAPAHAQTTGYTLKSLASFSGKNGSDPLYRLIDVGGVLYGTTVIGGRDDGGMVFSFNPMTRALTEIASFNGANGAHPVAALITVGGIFYGTAAYGGTIFELVPNTPVVPKRSR